MKEKEIVETVRSFYPDVQAVYVFGTYGTDDERTDSDADVALLLPPETARREKCPALSDCCRALEDLLRRSVDLVNLREVSTVFQNEILNTGREIFVGDAVAAQEFEMLTLSFYQELTQERREIMEDFLRTGRAYNV